MINISKKNIPSSPGVYFFKNIHKQIIYIGKAKNLKSRIASYFQKSTGLSLTKQSMLQKIKKIDWQKTNSEIAALILEANLIKKYQPKYNIELKDDKSFLYIMIDLEPNLPLVQLIRKKDIEVLRNWKIEKLLARPPECSRAGQIGGGNLKLKDENHKHKQATKLYNRRQNNQKLFFGPYTSAKSVKIILKYLKRIFPYKTHIKTQKKPCLAYYFKKCTEPCIHTQLTKTDYIKIKKEYKKIIENIILFLKGDFKKISQNIVNLIKKYSLNKNFEQAAKYKNILKALQNTIKHKNIIIENDNIFFENENIYSHLQKLQKLLNLKNIPYRIECYDVSNIQGKYSVGSMVVFKNGMPVKSDYRRFRIQTVNKISDVDMLSEIIKRRFKNYTKNICMPNTPDLILIDGGIPQINAAIKILQKINPFILEKIDIAALAKKEEILYLPQQKKSQVSKKHSFTKTLIQARNEAHRFAISYYRLKHSQSAIKSQLDKIPGVGLKRKKALLKIFGSNEEPCSKLQGIKQLA